MMSRLDRFQSHPRCLQLLDPGPGTGPIVAFLSPNGPGGGGPGRSLRPRDACKLMLNLCTKMAAPGRPLWVEPITLLLFY